MDKLTPAVALLGRLLISAIFLWSGIAKLGDPAAYIAMSGLPFPSFAYLVAVVVECGGGLALLLGFRARAAAAALAAFTLVAAIGFHAQAGDLNQSIHFMKDLAIAGGLLQIVAFGPGGWAFAADGRRAATLRAASQA
ncbi:MAG: DoxX family protein [Rhodospirillales bacterium]|nr:DoxX family protein [Rhodospirillales bacterium]